MNVNTTIGSGTLSAHMADENKQTNDKQINPLEFNESDKAYVSDALANNNRQLLLANLYHYFIECKNYKTAISLLKESDVPISISRDLVHDTKLLLISPEEKKRNPNIRTFVIEHNNLEIELFENQYIKSKSSMPRDGSFMVQWWDCLWSIYNNVNSQPLELLSSVRPFIDVIKPIFPESVPANGGSPTNMANPDPNSMKINRPDMYTNPNLMRGDYPQKGSPYPSPYTKGNENLTEEMDPMNFANTNYKKMNQKPALHKVRQSSITSPHNISNMQFNNQKKQQYVSGIPTALNSTDMKPNMNHQDPKFYPQDGVFKAPTTQKRSMSAGGGPPNEGSLYGNSYNSHRLSIQEEFAKQNGSPTQPNNIPYPPGMMNPNVQYSDMPLSNYPVDGVGNVQMMKQYQQGKQSRIGSQSFGNSVEPPTGNVVNNGYNAKPPMHPYNQGPNQYFGSGNEDPRMDKMPSNPLFNINEGQEQDYKNGHAAKWSYSNNGMRNTPMETTPKVQDFMEMSNGQFNNGVNFQYQQYGSSKGSDINPPSRATTSSGVNPEAYNSIRISPEIDNTTIKKKPTGKPKGRPKKVVTADGKDTKKPAKPKKTKAATLKAKKEYLENLGEAEIVFQKDIKSMSTDNKSFGNTFDNGYMMPTQDIANFDNDTFSDLYKMVASDSGLPKDKISKRDLVDSMMNTDFGDSFPPLPNNAHKLMTEDTNGLDLLDTFLMQEMSGGDGKSKKRMNKKQSDFANGMNFDLSDQGH